VTQQVLGAARAMDREVVVASANNEDDFEPAFANFSRQGVGGLLVGTGSPFTSRRARLVELAARHKIPAIYQLRIFAVDGGLMTYGASAIAAVRLAAGYVAQILKGTKPADLPVQQSYRFEFVLNFKTAKALGIEIPPMLLTLADEVIE
jgi:putative ABC transport system substrate-binding protein